MDVKVGDVVHVRFIVTHTSEFGHFDALDGEGDLRACLVTNDIVHVEPASLKVGDKVRIFGDGRKGEIIGVCRDKYWIDLDGVTCLTYSAAALERV